MTGNGSIGVLVAAPSAQLRARIRNTLRDSGRMRILAETADGRSVMPLCEQTRPDVLVMHPMLTPVGSPGITEQLMKRCPRPILLISSGSATDQDELSAVRSCMAAGAVDVFAMPGGAQEQQIRDWNRGLVAAVTVVSRIRVVTQHAPRRSVTAELVPPSLVTPPLLVAAQEPAPAGYSVIAIGASTGGPAAITAVLTAIPASPAIPILLVLHVDPSFHPSLTRWLRNATGHRVRTAEPGETLIGAAGQVITAPPGRHLEVRNGLLMLTDSPPRHSCRPSVDVLFDSIAADCGPRSVACLLTGMGRDGAAGLLAVRKAGGITIAQDQATSVVYGMPAEAARLGAAQRVLPIDQIGLALNSVAARRTIVT